MSSPAAPAPPGLTPLSWEPRVLVVDDDPVVRLAASRLLARLGLVVEVAVDGHEAVAMSAAWPYVAIFMDCYMPEIDGYRTTREIHARDGGDARPLIIAVTSRPRHVCLAAGMDHHIAKPVRADVLERDCRALGLLPGPGLSDPLAGHAADQVIAAADGCPVLARSAGITPERLTDFALAFATRLQRRLPRLWRAANTADGDALLPLAGDLAGRAARAHAARLAALLGAIAQLCEAGQPQAAARVVATLQVQLDALVLAAAEAEPGTAEALGGTASAAATPRPLRVAVADDDPFARAAVEAIIRAGTGLEFVGSAAGAAEIVELAAELAPDVVVVDVVMPGGGGPSAARQIREHRPATRIVALSASETPETYLAMLQAGASGVLVKGSPPSRLVELIHRAAHRSA
jgi:CheY-like chemotaxis protein